MAALTQTRRPTAARAPAPKKDEPAQSVKRVAAPPKKEAAPPAPKAKLAVSQPGDAMEQEADKVASQVARSPRPDAKAGAGASAAKGADTLHRASLQPGLDKTAAVPAALTLQRRATDEKKPLQRRAEPGADHASAAPKADAEASVAKSTEQRIEGRRGQGSPLPAAVQADMESRFGQDFGTVRLHTDTEARELCADTQARAFTVGHDIFFAPGEYAPDSDAGRELLAHELTHVVQNGDAVQRLSRAVDPAPSPVPTSGSAAATALAELSVLELPPIKHRHAALYAGTGSRRAAGYARNTSEEQVAVWNSGIVLTEDTIEQKLRARDPNFTRPTNPAAMVNFRAGSETLSSTWRTLRGRLLIPEWDRRGTHLTAREDRFQVDHMVELQVFGDTTGNAGNVIGNLELLKGSPNASSGSTIKNAIYTRVANWLAASDPGFNALSEDQKKVRRRTWLATHAITFTEIRRGEGRAGNDADWWTRAEIEAAAPLDAVQPAPATRLRGSSGNFVLASGVGGVEISRYTYTALPFGPGNDVAAQALAGLRIVEFNLNNAMEVGNAGDPIGSLRATWNLPNGFRSGEPVTIPMVAVGPYCGALGAIPALNTDFSHLSPISLPTLEIRDGHLYGEGALTPSLPLLAGHPINVVLDGNDLRFEMRFSTGAITLPVPGITIEDSSLSLFYSTQRGLGGTGQVDFAVPRLGSGELVASVTQADGFSAQGGFHFDTRLFDQADARVWYRNRAFGGEGTLGITSPNKIRGIRSARLTVGFGENSFTANGEVQPDIPGVQQASLRVNYGEDTGLTIGGQLQLAPNPAIRSGTIDVTVTQRDDTWKVAATGTAQPAIPGLNSELTVGYDDGAFTAGFRGAFQRGMLSGTVDVGATNRSLDPAGQPTGDPVPGAPLIVYGGGSATLRLAPWLQGTAGLRFAPNGEVTVRGEIGLPSSLELFSRKEINKPLFSMSTQIPIVPGIVAEVGGNLSAKAGIGPGSLDQCRVGIEYNPAHEDQTHVTGDAHLNIPADAGLRLAARAGIGLGITGAADRSEGAHV